MKNVIRTSRLTLRPLEMTDADVITSLIADWDVIKWLTSPPYPYAVSDATWFIGDESSNGSYAIVLDGTFCGVVGFGEELGYWLGKPFWGRGIMTEAARAVVADQFARGHDRLRSGYVLGNTASENVLTKLGFVKTDIREDFSAPRNEKVRLQEMVLTRENWESDHAQRD